jgi:aerobic carbon-monoxide dehydrogenase small subunit
MPQEDRQKITLTVNGMVRTLEIGRRETLLDVIREQLHLTGTKYGCGTGDCGTCMVLVDGEPTTSCNYLARRADGKQVTTIEGLTDGEQLSPLQQAFVDAGAVQCGFCIPGMVITASALLRRNPNPSRDEIAQALDGNLCRCTGYAKIIDAIELAARRLREAEAVQHG